MKITVVMCQHAGDDEIQDVYAFTGEVPDDQAIDRALTFIAADMLGEGNQNSDLWPTAATAIEHAREVIDFTVKITELRG
jgi:hypothetical protein